MGKILMFVVSEKAIKNFYRYGYERRLLPFHLMCATTNHIANNYPELRKSIKFDSNWTSKDTQILHLYFLWKNFFEKRNKALNYELRNRILGPYKILTLKNFYNACKYMKNTFFAINWIFFFKNYKLSNHALLKVLRENKIIGFGDVDLYKNIISQNSIEKIIIFTPFRDPKLYDLSEACELTNCALHVFPECWDNISSGYGLPAKISTLHLWSLQQLRDLKRFYPVHVKNTVISGTYRRNYANKYIKNNEQSRQEIFRILYLEGYFYEDLDYVFNKIRAALSIALIDKNIKLIEITVRRYPLKRQSVDYQSDENWVGKYKINNVDIVINESKVPNLASDFINTRLVLSELTTAGLEACFRRIPTFFIGCKASKKYLDSVRGYNYSFAEDLVTEGLFINLSRKPELNKFAKKLSLLFTLQYETEQIKFQLSNINFYAEFFDFENWNKLIRNNSE